MSKELVERLRVGAEIYGCYDVMAQQMLTEAADAIERLTYDSIHTCHDDCPRLPCVQRREIERLREALAAMAGEIAALHKRIEEQRDEIIRLDLDLCEISKGEDW